MGAGVEVSTVRHSVGQLKVEEGEAVALGERIDFLRTEFKRILNIGKILLKFEEIMWESDCAQL